jgi:diphthine-ammonia ligase
MTTSALVSGGKDSVYATYLADSQGWPVDELVTLRPTDPESPLFHVPNLDLVALQAAAWGKRHRVVPVGAPGTEGEESALAAAISAGTGPVVVGAIASSYQWSRVLRAASRVGRRVYAPLWRVDAGRVVREEIAAGLDIRLVHLSAEPLSSDLLGRRLDRALLDELERRSRSVRQLNVAGEGGEYETLVVDAPFFRQRIAFEATEEVVTPSTARLVVTRANLKIKTALGASDGPT